MMGLLLLILCLQCSDAFAHHEGIGIPPDKVVLHVEGEPVTTSLIISTGNVTFDHRDIGPDGETRYFVSFQDTSFESGRSMPAYNRTLTVPLMKVIMHNYTRQLPAGTWIVTTEVRDSDQTGELLFNTQTSVVVKGAEFVVLQRQATAEEDNVIWTKYGVIISALTALGAGLGGAALGAHFSRRAARQQWEETKGEMEKDRKISANALEISKESTRLQLRPWIGRVDLTFEGAYFKNGLYVTATQVPNLLKLSQKVDRFVFKFWMENYGQLPALHFSMGYSIATTDDPNAILGKSDLERVTLHQDVAVMPREKIPMTIELPGAVFARKRIVVVGRAKYQYSGGDGFYDFIVEFDRVNWKPLHNEVG